VLEESEGIDKIQKSLKKISHELDEIKKEHEEDHAENLKHEA